MIRLVVLLVVCAVSGPAAAADSAAALAERGHWKRARALADSRLKANAADAEALWLMSQVKMVWQDPEAALSLAEKAVALDGRNVEYRWQLAQVVGELASNANVFRQIGLARRFKREVDAALAIDPKHIPSLNGLMMFFYRAPGIVGGDKQRAETIVNQIGVIDKAQGYLAQARLAARANQQDRIQSLYERAAEANPSLFEPHAGLANIYSSQQKWDLAEKEALAAKRIDPDRASPYVVAAGVYASQERWADLDAILAEGEKEVPDHFGPYLRAAVALLTTGKDLPRAERYARKYLTQEPEPGAPSFAIAHWRLGLVLEKQGRKSEAITEIEIATKLDKKFEPAQKDLRRLR